MSHSHQHSHAAPPADHGRAFAIGIALNLGFVVIEAVMGFVSGSLALVSDAGHNLSDVLGLVLAWVAAILARRPASQRFTYGLKRSTILAALGNALLLLVGVGAIAFEAVRRISHPEPVEGGVVAWVAGAGILINGFTAWLFMAGRKEDLNIHGAFLHMVADAAVSLGVMIAGFVILTTGWLMIDPIVSLVVVVAILWGTWGLFKESLGLSLDAVPAGVDPDRVREFLAKIRGVEDVHHLHIWGLSTTEIAMTVHVLRSADADPDELLDEIREELHEHFGIAHPTVQIECRRRDDCDD